MAQSTSQVSIPRNRMVRTGTFLSTVWGYANGAMILYGIITATMFALWLLSTGLYHASPEWFGGAQAVQLNTWLCDGFLWLIKWPFWGIAWLLGQVLELFLWALGLVGSLLMAVLNGFLNFISRLGLRPTGPVTLITRETTGPYCFI